MKISIIGTGVFSLSLALRIKNTHNIVMWSENKELVEHFNKFHDLPPISTTKIPNNILVTNSLEETLKNSNLIILGTSTKYVSNICQEIKDFYIKDTPIILASKGLELETGAFLTDIITEILKTTKIAVLGGPTFAKDLINQEICALNIATNDLEVYSLTQNTFDLANLKLEHSLDIYGLQLCGSIKNIIAIGSGILEGLKVSSSTKAFYLTKSFEDLKNILLAFNCNYATILTYAGLGDFILTATSSESRNFQLGKLIGLNSNIDIFLKENTVEGYDMIKTLYKLLQTKKLTIPIIEVLYKIIIKKENPHNLLDFLLL